jgi:hypothetical protein
LSKGSTVLGIFGLILVASSLGLGGFAWLTASGLQNQVNQFSEQNTWYRYNETSLNCVPSSYIAFSGLTIEFDIGTNESAYFSFAAQVHLEPSVPGFWSRVYVYFRIDGITRTDTHAWVGLFNGGTANLQIILQHIRNDLSPGVHNVTIAITGSSSGNYIHYSSLIVQKFPT